MACQKVDRRFMPRAWWFLWSLWLGMVVAIFALLAADSRYAFVPFALGMALVIGWNGYLLLVRRPRIDRSESAESRADN